MRSTHTATCLLYNLVLSSLKESRPGPDGFRTVVESARRMSVSSLA